MMAYEDRKMSLVATFDDLCRYTTVLTEGTEYEFQMFVKNQEECRKQWLATELEAQRLQLMFNKAQADIHSLEAKLKHSRNTLEMEMEKRKRVEKEKESIERQLTLIREILLTDSNGLNDQTKEKLAFLNNSHFNNYQRSPNRLDPIDESAGSILSPSDITEDDLDVPYIRTRRRNKRSNGHVSIGNKRTNAACGDLEDTPAKKEKNIELNDIDMANESVIATTTVTCPGNGNIMASARLETIPKHNRSFSEPTPSAPKPPLPRGTFRSEGAEDSDDSFFREPSKRHSIGFTTPKQPGTLSRQITGSGLNKNHVFCTKTVIKPEICVPCGKRIKFGKMALKCKDCRTTCHSDCKDLIPLPCAPTVNTPISKGMVGLLSDYAPSTAPMIPSLIIHCINEVENRGLSEVGLYRVPGSEKEVKDLKEKFLKGKGIPCLSKCEIHVICGCLKDFLRHLRESLITRKLWKNFVNAAENEDLEECLSGLYEVIHELPQPNRDTLAFLILHLQRVAVSPPCKMSLSNLAKVFGPTVVGYSEEELKPIEMLNETRKQALVMERLLTIPGDFWCTFINIDATQYPAAFSTPDTPEGRPSDGNLLGPLSPTPRISLPRKAKTILSHTPLAPREKTRSMKRAPRYFASPMLD